MVGHYAAGARVIGLTETQLRRHMETLKARHAAGDNKSPYAEPLHIIFGTKKSRRARKRKELKPEAKSAEQPIESQGIAALSATRGKIRLNFGLSLTPTMPAAQVLGKIQQRGKVSSLLV